MLPQKLPIDLMQTQWAAQLNPLLTITITNGSQLTGVKLGAAVPTVINHLLSRNMQGWFITDVDGPATIYRSAAFNDKTLTLTSSAAVTVNIWVY